MATGLPIGEAASTGSRGRRTSCVWEFFVSLRAATDTGAQDRARCPTCLRELSAGRVNGTSHLRRHRCYKQWLNINRAPAVPVPPAAPDAAAPPPPSPVAVVAADDDVFIDLADIVTFDDDDSS